MRVVVDAEEAADLSAPACLCVNVSSAPPPQVSAPILSCKACLAPLQADPEAIRGHALTHLSELGLCALCGASVADRAAGVAHALSHVGAPLLTCDMCQLQFCSRSKLLRHHRQAATSYAPPPPQLGGGLGAGAELQCAVCSKTLSKDFQVGVYNSVATVTWRK